MPSGRPGKWLETTAQHEDTLQGQIEEILVLRELPPTATAHSSRLQPAARQQRPLQSREKEAAGANPFPSSPFLLDAFMPAYPGEPAQSIEARMRTSDSCWAEFMGRIQVRHSQLIVQVW